MARTFQNLRLFKQMTVLENVMSGMHCRTREGALGAMLRSPGQRREEDRIRSVAEECLDFVGILEHKDRLARNLPYGDQRRVEWARALATQPKLLLLRRARGRPELRREGAADGPHPPHPRGAQDHHLPDRARHGPGDADLGEGGRHRLRQARSPRATATRSRATPRSSRPTWAKKTKRATEMSETVLQIDGLQTYYGKIHALKGISLVVQRGPDRDPAGRQRRREEHHPEDHLRPDPGRRRARSRSWARTSPPPRPTTSCAWA